MANINRLPMACIANPPVTHICLSPQPHSHYHITSNQSHVRNDTSRSSLPYCVSQEYWICTLGPPRRKPNISPLRSVEYTFKFQAIAAARGSNIEDTSSGMAADSGNDDGTRPPSISSKAIMIEEKPKDVYKQIHTTDMEEFSNSPKSWISGQYVLELHFLPHGAGMFRSRALEPKKIVHGP